MERNSDYLRCRQKEWADRHSIGFSGYIFGDTYLSHAYEINNKIFAVGESYITLTGTAAYFLVMRKLLTGMGEDCKLNHRDDIFETFSKVHTILKDQYFLNTKEDKDDPYESSQITALIANSYGIFGVHSYREVFSFDRFWGIGSDRNFALGAMYAVYEQDISARRIVESGMNAGVEFAKSSATPLRLHTVEMKT